MFPLYSFDIHNVSSRDFPSVYSQESCNFRKMATLESIMHRIVLVSASRTFPCRLNLSWWDLGTRAVTKFNHWSYVTGSDSCRGWLITFKRSWKEFNPLQTVVEKCWFSLHLMSVHIELSIAHRCVLPSVGEQSRQLCCQWFDSQSCLAVRASVVGL